MLIAPDGTSPQAYTASTINARMGEHGPNKCFFDNENALYVGWIGFISVQSSQVLRDSCVLATKDFLRFFHLKR
jgi:hypothetical protein